MRPRWLASELTTGRIPLIRRSEKLSHMEQETTLRR
jgi:hypothetical protein